MWVGKRKPCLPIISPTISVMHEDGARTRSSPKPSRMSIPPQDTDGRRDRRRNKLQTLTNPKKRFLLTFPVHVYPG